MLYRYKEAMKQATGADIVKFLLDEDENHNFIVGVAYTVPYISDEPLSIEYMVPAEIAIEFSTLEELIQSVLKSITRIIHRDVETFKAGFDNTLQITGE